MANHPRYTKLNAIKNDNLAKFLHCLGVFQIAYDSKLKRWNTILRLTNPLTYVYIILITIANLIADLTKTIIKDGKLIIKEINELNKQVSFKDNDRYWRYKDAPKK